MAEFDKTNGNKDKEVQIPDSLPVLPVILAALTVITWRRRICLPAEVIIR